jgi:hypoxanthine phosphoribosyltransferase
VGPEYHVAPFRTCKDDLIVRVLIAADALAARVAELAAELDRDYRQAAGRARTPDDPVIAVGVLKGAMFFLADLLKQMAIPVAVDFVQAASYGSRGTNRGEVSLRKDLDLPVRDRDVLVVEDIVDSGWTVNALLELLRFRGARSVRLCTLLDKRPARAVAVPIDYTGFVIEDLFVVGYGLDHAERHRNLPYVAVWEPEATATTSTASSQEPSGMNFHHSDHAPAAIGPYSQAVTVDGWTYTSGQVGLDPQTGELVPGGFDPQARRALENLRQVLAAAGCTFADVVKAGVFVVDMADFPRLNALYAEAMGDHRPARSTVQVAALPKGALVEIDLVAHRRTP